MNEAGFWLWLREHMKGYWHANRIESATGAGIPDVTFGVKDRQGWIELKWLKYLPKRDTTGVKLSNFTPLQRLWLKRRGKLSGDTWLFVRVADEVFLFDWTQVNTVDTLTAEEWRREAKFYSTIKDFNPKDLYQTLAKGCQSGVG